MASSTHPGEEHVPADHDGMSSQMVEQIHVPNPIPSSNPHEAKPERTNQGSRKRPPAYEKLREEKGNYTLTDKDVKEVTEWDEFFKASSEFRKYENVWAPMSERLADWRLETRKRKNGGKIETFYHQPRVRKQLRSMKQVTEYLHYGFLLNKKEGSSSLDADNSFPESLIKKHRTQKEMREVEEFLAEARRNLMNLAHDVEDENEVL